MAIMLHDGLYWTYRTSICHVHFYDTTGRLGLGAFFGVVSPLRQFPAFSPFSLQPYPEGVYPCRVLRERTPLGR